MLLYDNHKKRYLVISDLVGTNWSASSDVTTIGKIEEANYSGDEWPEKFTPLNNMKECNVIHTGFFRDNSTDAPDPVRRSAYKIYPKP